MPHSHPSRYLVGIDLGTTHTVVAYADTAGGANLKIEVFPIEQLIAPGEIAARPLLPSVRYHPAPGEMVELDSRLPWSETQDDTRPIIGELARLLGSKSHGRAIVSAKSWLSHGGVDRTAPTLPWGGAEGVGKISPLEASASYLEHVRRAWNRHFPEHPLENQEIVVTVPASFDEAARSLTLEAARQAGLCDIRLVEEPQAACYDWVWRHRKTLAKQLAGVRLLLVVDVGGGTTDLTLIQVETGEEEPKLTRIGVGDHLMLGGDNLDLTLAHIVEHRLVRDRRLSAAELSQVVEQCRIAKESLLGEDAPAAASITLLGSGSKLIGGTRFTELSQEKVRQVVLDGFFPLTGLDELPVRKRGSAVVEYGLPYAQDPAIGKQVAAFLAQHRQIMQETLGEGMQPMPDAVLLNGGLFSSPIIVRRLLELLNSWRSGPPLKHLRNDRPDQAVAHGAVAYGLARRGLSVRKIGGGSARAYFLVVDTDHEETQHGVCLLPRGTDEGHEVFLAERSFALRFGQPVRFHLVSSVADTRWQPGDLTEIDPEHFVQLPPLAVAFDRDQGRNEVVVRLAATLTEVGTLKIQCVDAENPERRWNVEFQLRQTRTAPLQTPTSGLHPRAGEAVELIRMVFGKKTRIVDPKRIKGLRAELEKLLGKREDWDTALLRELFGALLEGLPHRRRSDAHERSWLSLTGYCLRPGFGYPLDDWRVEQIWALYDQGIQYHMETQNWAEWWTLWRRIAGGLNAQAQAKIFAVLADFIHPEKAKRGNLPAQSKKRSYEDMLRLAAVLERLPLADKTALGDWLLQRLGKPGEPAQTGWALGRIGARIPFHGGIEGVVPPETAETWLSVLLEFDWKKAPFAGFAATLISRMTGDRARDINPGLREQVVEKLRTAKSPETWLLMVTEIKELDEADEQRIFGEALPPGLKLIG
ncbi:MAG: hsp70 family protein [Methylococcaceae bacterium]|nr:hsp70 family protein [Methylococcaceae bacterium]